MSNSGQGSRRYIHNDYGVYLSDNQCIIKEINKNIYTDPNSNRTATVASSLDVDSAKAQPRVRIQQLALQTCAPAGGLKFLQILSCLLR